LDTFIKGELSEKRFQAVKKIRTHLEQEIYRARIDHIVSGKTLTDSSPHVLILKRKPQIMAQIAWRELRSEARAVVARVVEGDMLKVVMLERYDDALQALEGTKPFTFEGNLTIPSSVLPGPGQAPPSSHPAPSGAAKTMAASPAGGSPGGVKRKRNDTLVSEPRPVKRMV
jgi:hypothetical protein